MYGARCRELMWEWKDRAGLRKWRLMQKPETRVPAISQRLGTSWSRRQTLRKVGWWCIVVLRTEYITVYSGESVRVDVHLHLSDLLVIIVNIGPRDGAA